MPANFSLSKLQLTSFLAIDFPRYYRIDRDMIHVATSSVISTQNGSNDLLIVNTNKA
jgi:hypothetical protein